MGALFIRSQIMKDTLGKQNQTAQDVRKPRPADFLPEVMKPSLPSHDAA